MLILYLTFWEADKLFFTVTELLYILKGSIQGFLFLLILTKTCYFLFSFFHFNHSTVSEVVSHFGFDLHFPNEQWRGAPLHALLGHFSIFFRELSIPVLCSIFNQMDCLFLVVGVLYIFCILDLILCIICKYFLPFSRLSLHFFDNVVWCTKVFNFGEVQYA